MPHGSRPGDELGGRYTLVDLLSESRGGRFWRARDEVLARHVALHVISSADERAPRLLDAARRSAAVQDRRVLRVLDADENDGLVYVVNEWGVGTSLDILLDERPLTPRRAAWIVSEVADAMAAAHALGVPHGHLVPENVLVDHVGSVRIIGLAVDAALRGVDPGRVEDDLVDLAGLLYSGLTGRWAGHAYSEVEPAPTEGGSVLRPRRVRAGIPRALDHVCGDVLDGAHRGGPEGRRDSGPGDAAGLAALLQEFVGDPLEMAAAEAALGHGAPPAVDLSDPDPGGAAAPDGPTRRDVGPVEPVADGAEPTVAVPAPHDGTDDGDGAGDGDGDGDEDGAEEEPPASHPSDVPTQAGVPIFRDDTEEVDWVGKQQAKPPPPPPFEEPPERPLFAPDPPDGQPLRRSRPGASGAAGAAGPGDDRFWPWGTGTGDPVTGTGAGVVLEEPGEQTGEQTAVPGRSWFRLAVLVGVASLALLLVVFATDLLRGGQPLGVGPAPEDSPSASPEATEAAPSPVTGLDVRSLDPQGDGEESGEDAPLVADGDPASTWRTSTYFQQLGPQGLKTGVGLVVDLGESAAVREVDLRLVGSPTTARLYLTDDDPADVGGLEPVGRIEARGQRGSTELSGEASGRYLVLWLTRLPPVDGGFRGEIGEVVVRA